MPSGKASPMNANKAIKPLASRQISLFELDAHIEIGGCGNCLCKECLLGRSGRCPYGSCYDNWRNKHKPYDKEYPNNPPRTLWTNWKTDQGFWCRGGIFYPADMCSEYIRFDKSKTYIKECLEANVKVYQDGYISCSLIECLGCEYCYNRLMEKMEVEE